MTDTVINGVDYGPLALLIGEWKGNKGIDIAPESDGPGENNPFYEEILIEPVDEITNANKQKLIVVRYHQKVYEKKNNKQSHDQLGYWMWDSVNKVLMQSITIPRGVTLLAGGTPKTTTNSLAVEVSAAIGEEWGIVQSPFMLNNAKTTSYTMKLRVDDNKMYYSQKSILEIYDNVFEHTEENTLSKE